MTSADKVRIQPDLCAAVINFLANPHRLASHVCQKSGVDTSTQQAKEHIVSHVLQSGQKNTSCQKVSHE